MFKINNFKKIFLFNAILLMTSVTYGQTYTMSNGSITTCSGTLFDSGGAGGNYSNNETLVLTICSGNSSLIQLDFTSFDIENSFDNLTIYDGTNTSAPAIGTYTGNTSPGTVSASQGNASGCLTVVFDSDFSVTDPGWSANISCNPPCQNINPNVSFVPTPDPSDNIIEICQGASVDFNGSGSYPDNNNFYAQSDATSTFEWTIRDSDGNTSTETGQNVTHTFSDGGVYIVSLEITDVEGCTNSNTIDQVFNVSTTPVFDPTSAVRPEICEDEQDTLAGFFTPVPDSIDCTPPVAGVTPLPDGSGVSYSTSITVDCYDVSDQINSLSDLVSICMDLEHSYAGDLDIEIICPNGQSAMLVDYSSGSSPGATHVGEPVDGNTGTPGTPYTYCFTPTPTYGTWDAEAGNYQQTYTNNAGVTENNQDYFPAGSYQAEGGLSSLIGCPLNGNWTIQITDNLGIDDGNIFNWGVSFASSFTPNNLKYEPTIDSSGWLPASTIVAEFDDSIVVDPNSVGNKCFTYEVFDSTDNGACQYDTTVCFDVLPNPDLDPQADTVVCDSLTLPSITGVDLTGNEAYFDAADGQGTSYNAGDKIYNSTTLYIYDTMYVSPNCYNQQSFNVTVNTKPILDQPNDTVVCDTLVLPAIDGSNLTANAAYYDAPSAGGTQYLPGDKFYTAGNTTLYIYDSTATSPSCFDEVNFDATVNVTPKIDPIPDQEVCLNYTLPAITGDDLTGNESYYTQPGGNGISLSSGDVINVVGDTTIYVYDETATAPNCFQGLSFMITIKEPPNVVANASKQEICLGESVTLYGSGASTYSWDNGVTDNTPFQPTITQKYKVVGTDDEGCQNIDSITIPVHPHPNVDFTANKVEGCAPLAVSFTKTSSYPNADCDWSFGNGNTQMGCSAISNTYDAAGCFDVSLQIETKYGCKNDTVMKNMICVDPPIHADFGYSPADPNINDSQILLEDQSTGATSYQWEIEGYGSFTSENPVIDLPGTPETYPVELVVMNDSGCTDIAESIIKVEDITLFYVPNAFTPDGDSYNETFKPVMTSGFDPYDYTFTVFNKWGEPVFESHNANVGWDGTYRGEMVQDGVYVWKIEFKKLSNDERQTHTGSVTLLK